MAAERAPKYRLFSSFGLTQGSPIWAALVIYAGVCGMVAAGEDVGTNEDAPNGKEQIKGD